MPRKKKQGIELFADGLWKLADLGLAICGFLVVGFFVVCLATLILGPFLIIIYGALSQ